MTDVYSKEKRSYVMSKIRSKNTKPEILVRKYLFKQGFRFRVNVKRLLGTPDIVLRKYRSVIFVHGIARFMSLLKLIQNIGLRK